MRSMVRSETIGSDTGTIVQSSMEQDAPSADVNSREHGTHVALFIAFKGVLGTS